MKELVETLEQVNKALEMDLMLLKLEEQVGLMDGLPLIEEVAAHE